MKIVMCYSTDGGYECGSFDHVLCFEYESVEAFYCHFEEACRKSKQLYDGWRKALEEWNVQVRSWDFKKRRDSHATWMADHPEYTDVGNFKFCGDTFGWADFWEIKDYTFGDYIPPEVYELNEWFDKMVVNPG